MSERDPDQPRAISPAAAARIEQLSVLVIGIYFAVAFVFLLRA